MKIIKQIGIFLLIFHILYYCAIIPMLIFGFKYSIEAHGLIASLCIFLGIVYILFNNENIKL